MIRTRCSVCCKEIERVSSGGAARKISAALYAVCPSLSYHAMKFLIPDCTTSPIQERSSAGSARYHGRLSSSRFNAALVRRSVPPRRRRTSSWEAGGKESATRRWVMLARIPHNLRQVVSCQQQRVWQHCSAHPVLRVRVRIGIRG